MELHSELETEDVRPDGASLDTTQEMYRRLFPPSLGMGCMSQGRTTCGFDLLLAPSQLIDLPTAQLPSLKSRSFLRS